MLNKIINLRKELHQHPELSGQETQTAQRIKLFIEKHHNTKIIEKLGGNGLAAVYEFPATGPHIMIRCELDALPIEENNLTNYASEKKGISHKCGHDGHMAIVAGLIFKIKETNFLKGKITLLFQPAEETGQGAHAVLNDPKFTSLNPDYIFALHNIPGIPFHTIVPVKDNFSASVQSLAIHLSGKKSHASEPEKGINPAFAISEIINEFNRLNVQDLNDDKYALLTPIYINMGQKAYGVSAGQGEVHFTLRTWKEKEMEQLINKLKKILHNICERQKLKYRIAWFEYFPPTKNNNYCNQLIINAAHKNGFNIKEKELPFKFGEDFGWFSQKYKATMFGIGAGINSPALHHDEYDFPDELIQTGMDMFWAIISQLFECA